MIGQRGEIWTVDLDPSRGREQQKLRPAIIVSHPTAANAIGMAAIVPLTSTNRGWMWHVPIPATPSTGLTAVSYAMVEQLRSIDVASRLQRRIGMVYGDLLAAVDDKIVLYLGL